MTELRDAVTVITGAGSGIGSALARRFAAEGAAAVVVTDLDGASAERVAAEVGGERHALDVTDAEALERLVEQVLERHGRIDVFCSNAGIALGTGPADPLADWQRALDVNLLAHVTAARAVLPGMLARSCGHLLQTCSAAGLLSSPGDAAYAVSKHAAVALAEWLALTYAARGIRVSALCPMGVATPLLMDPLAAGQPAAAAVAASGPILAAEDVADAVVEGLCENRFLILPHPQVARYWAAKAADPQRWLDVMSQSFSRQARSDAVNEEFQNMSGQQR
ncbi:MAG: SDR family oxidoreductase [bacterium]